MKVDDEDAAPPAAASAHGTEQMTDDVGIIRASLSDPECFGLLVRGFRFLGFAPVIP